LNSEQAGTDPGWPPAALHDLVPVAGPHVMIAAFCYPLPDLIPVLEGGQRPADVPPLDQPMLLLFHKQPRGLVHMVKINAPSAALVEACDGERTVAGLVDKLSRQFGPDVEAPAIAALDWLRRGGVVGLRKGH
jgi:Coenzyme PQQ synthesis protein D (PqqD)